MKRIKDWMIKGACVCFLMAWGLAMPVLAAPASGTVKNSVLNVRSDASTSSSIVCKLSKGMTVKINSEKAGTDGKTWYEVSFTYNNGTKKGYVRSDLINAAASVPSVEASSGQQTDTEYYKVSVNSANVRKQASASSARVASLPRGTDVKQKSVTQGADGRTWYRISFTYNGQKTYGYIRSDLVTASATGSQVTTTPTVTAPTGTAGLSGVKEGDKLYINASAVRIRESAGDTYKVITNLLQGDQVEFIKEKTGDDGKKWAKVKCYINDTKYMGYVRSDLLTRVGSSTANSGDTTDYRYVSASGGVRVRKSADAGAAVVANLLRGDRAKFIKEKKGSDGKQWTKVSFTLDSTRFEGYIPSSELSKTAL